MMDSLVTVSSSAPPVPITFMAAQEEQQDEGEGENEQDGEIENSCLLLTSRNNLHWSVFKKFGNHLSVTKQRKPWPQMIFVDILLT